MREGATAAQDEQRTATEAVLGEIWTEVLGIPVGLRDDFFDLGGTSLAAVQIASRALDAGLAVDPLDLSELPTVAELARAVDARREGGVDREAAR